ncbi:MAG TPA: HAD family hydrolase [Dehalococcoidia bacterium]|nr:HAD family hydrolase [Dehalococcoidia bacterium]
MIRAVVFDLGHTLWDIEPDDGELLAAAYRAFREELGARLGRDDLPAAEAIQRAVRDALVADAPMYFAEGPELRQPPSHSWVERGCRAAGLVLDEALLRELTPPLFATEIERLACGEGTVAAVRALDAEGYALGCVTNTLADTASIRAMLRRHGLEDVMRSVVVSADEGWRKPHSSLFAKALRELAVAPHEAVFVGDSPYHDIAGAKAAGMRAVLTQQYAVRPHDGMEPPPDAVISHVRELREVIRRMDGAHAGAAPAR